MLFQVEPFNILLQSNDDFDKNTYKVLYNKCSTEIQKFNVNNEQKLLNKNNLNSFYNFVNKKLTNRSGIGNIRSPDGVLSNSDSEKCDIFNDFFC